MSAVRLDLGALDLTSSDGGGESYWFELLADGFSPGSPEAVRTIVASLLRDGANSRIDSFGNRTITFRVRVKASDSGALGDGERALARELGSPSTLTFQPPDGYSTTVWDVFNGTLEPEVEDLAWNKSPMWQTYVVSLECFPWSRPATKTSVTFTPSASATPTTLDDASSAAAWAGMTFTTTTWGSDASVLAGTPTYSYVGTTTGDWPLAWTGSVGAHNYIGIDLATKTAPTYADVAVGINYVRWNGAAPVAVEASPIAGFQRYVFANTGAAANFTLNLTYYGTSYTGGLLVGGIYGLDATTADGRYVAEIGGAVRTTGGITVSRASGITNLFLYSDPSMISGWSPNVAASWFRAPEGDYSFWVKTSSLPSANPGDLVVLSVTGPGSSAQTLRARVPSADGTWLPLGVAALGGLRDKTIGTLTTALTHNGSPVASPTLRMFRRKARETALTYYTGPTSGTTTQLTVDIPSLEHEHGGVWADGVDALGNCPVWEYPEAEPPQLVLSALMDATSGVSITFEHFRRYHTYVGE